MPRLLELLRWKARVLLASRPARASVLPLVLSACALSGWGAFVGKASTSRHLTSHISLLQADRDGLMARTSQLEQANTELLRDGQGKLAALREELSQAIAARDAAKSQLANAQRELVASKKRLDQARDRVSETGSIKPVEPPRKPAVKP